MTCSQKHSRRFRFSWIGALTILVATALAMGFRPVQVDADSVAIGGYDVVAYHTEQQAIAGSPLFIVRWSGAVWRFSSNSNMRSFSENPERFAPVFGGHCAMGVAVGVDSPQCNPQVFVVYDERLFLFGSEVTRDKWLQDADAAAARGDAAWDELIALYRQESGLDRVQ